MINKTHPLRSCMNELQFLKLMNKGLSDLVWQRVDYIQTCINSQVGIGKKIVINYFATINSTKSETEVRIISYSSIDKI